MNNSTLNAPSYDLKLDGAMNADSTATLGGAGKMHVEIAGLDGILTNLQARMANADALEKAKLQKLIQTLGVINLAGQAEKRGDKTYKIYDFELAKDGRMLLNGSDLSLLTGIPPAKAADSAPTTDTPKAR